jgi:hypothetical protein
MKATNAPTTDTLPLPLPASLLALKENARRARDEAGRARRREEREAALGNWHAFAEAVRAAIPADLLPFAGGLEAMPEGWPGALKVREVTFRLPGHLPLVARFERPFAGTDYGPWKRTTVGNSPLALDAPNAEGRPQWAVGPYPGGYWRHAATLGEALLLAEDDEGGRGEGGRGGNGADGDEGGIDLAALANSEDGEPPF